MDNKNIKVTFGLQPHHIETIENEFKRWQDMPPLESFPEYTCRPEYIKAVWDDLGRKVGWCPFTLSLYYFRYLEDKGKEPLVDTGSKESIDIEAIVKSVSYNVELQSGEKLIVVDYDDALFMMQELYKKVK